jgi:hypothetical protein
MKEDATQARHVCASREQLLPLGFQGKNESLLERRNRERKTKAAELSDLDSSAVLGIPFATSAFRRPIHHPRIGKDLNVSFERDQAVATPRQRRRDASVPRWP